MPKVKLFWAQDVYDGEGYRSDLLVLGDASDWEEVTDEELATLKLHLWEISNKFKPDNEYRYLNMSIQDCRGVKFYLDEIAALLKKKEEEKIAREKKALETAAKKKRTQEQKEKKQLEKLIKQYGIPK